MSEAPEQQQPSDSQPSRRWLWWRSLQATATRRALLLTALGGLLIAGVTTALPAGANDAGRLVGHSNAVPEANRASQAFDNARPGDCLNWPNKEPDQATVVDCKDEHRFEVATSVDMRMFPGSEYGPNAAAPSAARVQQISQEQCQAAIKRYLGTKYDPNSKFTIGMLWSGTKAWSAGDRQMLCGLQLPGGGNEEQQAVKGRVADLDQSKVWQAGTCLGIDTAANQPTDIPIDCAGPHAMEVTGSVNVAEKFPGGALPPEADQDAYIKDTCTRMTDAYLAPVELRTTTLTLVYSTVSLPSWSAGSHQVSCSIGATLGNGGWATLVGSAKGALLINGQPPVPPPDIPAERLNIPPIRCRCRCRCRRRSTRPARSRSCRSRRCRRPMLCRRSATSTCRTHRARRPSTLRPPPPPSSRRLRQRPRHRNRSCRHRSVRRRPRRSRSCRRLPGELPPPPA